MCKVIKVEIKWWFTLHDIMTWHNEKKWEPWYSNPIRSYWIKWYVLRWICRNHSESHRDFVKATLSSFCKIIARQTHYFFTSWRRLFWPLAKKTTTWASQKRRLSEEQFFFTLTVVIQRLFKRCVKSNQ